MLKPGCEMRTSEKILNFENKRSYRLEILAKCQCSDFKHESPQREEQKEEAERNVSSQCTMSFGWTSVNLKDHLVPTPTAMGRETFH